MYEDIGSAITILFIACIIFVPFGIWKVIELIIALFNHIKWVS